MKGNTDKEAFNTVCSNSAEENKNRYSSMKNKASNAVLKSMAEKAGVGLELKIV